MIVKINARFLYRQEVVPKNHLSILLTLKYNANLIYRLGQPSNLRWDSNFRKIYVFDKYIFFLSSHDSLVMMNNKKKQEKMMFDIIF
ncbi:hypothetical protein KVR801_230142 [Klebsiella variicola]|nr:hypothetical protein AM459_11600 [Klebsiella pneumoniae]OSZ05842.1 hypothetical protein BVZ23_27215 [Klebsiella variicola]PXM39873.1 hypothetical protein DMT39_19035 [Klebsiella variicola]CEL85897.1 hypothetical protein KVR801_230142 [Klebsiella variicola]HBY0380527.1 hypothetical protein [Klebsiella variicola]